MKTTTKTKKGRPPKKATDKRMYVYQIRLTKSEVKALHTASKEQSKPIAVIFRDVISTLGRVSASA